MTERNVVVLSGSTRAASTNTAFARTAAAHPPAGATVTAWTALTGLPHFDPDLDRDPLPAPVAALRGLLAGANAVVLCTPEYAGALPGAFKNAPGLDRGQHRVQRQARRLDQDRCRRPPR